jgi:hypothetical protein
VTSATSAISQVVILYASPTETKDRLRLKWGFRRSQGLHQVDHLLAHCDVGDAVVGADQFQRFAFGELVDLPVGKRCQIAKVDLLILD